MKMMWKGAISFGLVSIPVKMFLASEEKSVSFHQLHDADHGHILYARICSVCGQEIPYEHIVRGYEYERNQYVVLEPEDFAAVPVPSGRIIDLVQFVRLEEIDPVYFKRSYYLIPDEIGIKAFHLLRQSMATGGRVGIGKISFREKEHLVTIRAHDNVLVLETMYWPDEIRQPTFDELAAEISLRPQELEMAQMLIDNLTQTWDPKQFRDEYREALLDIIDRKVAGEEIEAPAATPAGQVVDLMEALRASVEAAKRSRQAAAGG